MVRQVALRFHLVVLASAKCFSKKPSTLFDELRASTYKLEGHKAAFQYLERQAFILKPLPVG
jgi:hypothetical protein